MKRYLLAFILVLFAVPVAAQEKARTISAKTAGLQKIDGYFPLYWDEENGKMFMEISRFHTQLLYQLSLPAGVGSNPIGLDRGQLGGSYVVTFERVGPKVLMINPNFQYRAITNDERERKSVEESFAQSVLWGFKVEAAEGDRVLVDATAFFMRDAHGVADQLRRTRQGRYRLDDSRSAFFLERTKGFPFNTEVEATLTFTTDEDPGAWVQDTVPDPHSITVREHHSFVQLPGPGYTPRKLDPRVGVFGLEFADYATPIKEEIEQRWIIRHRLEKKDPTAAISDPVKPIVYYVDNGVPEPIRSALIEGASWWNAAFEAAGFRNAFQVKVLPADADPMDIRYNMINWVHRSTRGWSYGSAVHDPRTGEIIKGNVTLGSLRARQDYMIGTGLIPIYSAAGRGTGESGMGCDFGTMPDIDYLEDMDPSIDPEAMVLARIRQLAAHEVGHTLGLAHNFAASTYGRASVMDYPPPVVEIKNGKLDLSNAYSKGIGTYDKFAITFGYAQFAPGTNESLALDQMVTKAVASGMLFISDGDSRPAGAAQPLSNLWDSGDDPIAGLRHEMEVRRIGLSQFGMKNIKNGVPFSELETKLVPLYLHHRYQLQAAVKSLGGVYYTYSVKTASGPSPSRVQEIVPAERQVAAMNAVLDTISPGELEIPQRILEMIPPRAFGYQDSRHTELFGKRTSPAFDPVSAATIAADLAISGLLEPHRAARLIEFHALQSANPDFREVVSALLRRTWGAGLDSSASWSAQAPFETNSEYQALINRAVQSLVVDRLMDLAANPDAQAHVRAVATEALRQLSARLKGQPGTAGTSEAPHRRATAEDIDRFLARPDATRKPANHLEPPPGDPIGSHM